MTTYRLHVSKKALRSALYLRSMHRGSDIRQGLVSNGAKVYVVALPSEPIEEKVAELNELGRRTGGSAHGQVAARNISNNLNVIG